MTAKPSHSHSEASWTRGRKTALAPPLWTPSVGYLTSLGPDFLVPKRGQNLELWAAGRG